MSGFNFIHGIKTLNDALAGERFGFWDRRRETEEREAEFDVVVFGASF
ncbi:hypothetical protein KIH41_15280 [Litoribacter ruber]|uniref:Uncharacterized protein n=1 Tax=Litoribacter ruber TaxID=702568 RepID=A0AAP2G1U9_9BACT|nr:MULTISPECIES: hypothetical protein [Litoribacter]MBS9524767.1 hypothetical protein [Litoribacter alkaliphilus]MBT0812650.1 hypothetical protein [Litoribacter ruber]